jgi:hypothetical protein
MEREAEDLWQFTVAEESDFDQGKAEKMKRRYMRQQKNVGRRQKSIRTLELERRDRLRPVCKLVNAAEVSPVLWLHTYRFW